ncbi:MAG: hypothetical protein ND807_17870 [Vicinamibacterales bacterium]|nr:hypothetical protein [Vicinamibacterales bacterium]
MGMNWLPSSWRNWGATPGELTAARPGDRAVRDPNYTTTLAITLAAPPENVWPWLVQIGYRRGGLYSYDWLDRLFGFLDRPSTDRILPEFQHLKAGDIIPIGRGARWPVIAVEPRHVLVMGGKENGVEWSWAFSLEPVAPHHTRLISRNRVRIPDTIGSRLFMLLLEPAAFLMSRRMLLGIKQRVECRRRTVRATKEEREEPLPGDEIIATPLASLTHATTIQGAREEVWPWLAQMGAGRAGWYSYDRFDNGALPSAERIYPALQQIAPGTVFPALPGATDGFVLIKHEPMRWLVLGWPDRAGRQMVTWAFILREAGPHTTRLITRATGSEAYRFRGLPPWLGLPLVRLVHFVMQRKQLLGIANRVERLGGARANFKRAS